MVTSHLYIFKSFAATQSCLWLDLQKFGLFAFRLYTFYPSLYSLIIYWILDKDQVTRSSCTTIDCLLLWHFTVVSYQAALNVTTSTVVVMMCFFIKNNTTLGSFKVALGSGNICKLCRLLTFKQCPLQQQHPSAHILPQSVSDQSTVQWCDTGVGYGMRFGHEELQMKQKLKVTVLVYHKGRFKLWFI